MPDYKLEMKRALYEKNLKEGKEKDNFLLMMNVLGSRTPDEFIEIAESRLEKAERQQTVFAERAQVKQDKINLIYDAEVEKIRDAYNQEVAGFGEEAPRLASVMNSMKILSNDWDAGDTIEERWKKVNTQDTEKREDSYKKTDAYNNLYIYQKITFDSYYNDKKIYDSIQNKEQLEESITAAMKKRDDSIKEITSKKPDLLSETNPADEEVEKYRGNIQQMTEFKEGQYEKMLNVKTDNLSEGAKKAGTDLLTEARAEYRNNCNWWERIWANILPSYLYSKAAYVEKINAYKETLEEAGFSKTTIEFADPDKSGNYLYSKKKGRYFKNVEASNYGPEEEDPFASKGTESSKSLDDSFSEYSAVDFDNDEPHFLSENVVPAKENSQLQQNFQKGLGEVIGNDKSNSEDLSKPKTNSDPHLQHDPVKKD